MSITVSIGVWSITVVGAYTVSTSLPQHSHTLITVMYMLLASPRLKRVLKRAHRMDFTFQFHDLDDLNEIAQYKLFRSSRSQQRCLNQLYTVKSRSLGAMRLRTRGQDFVLPTIKYEFNKRHFIVRFYPNVTTLRSGLCYRNSVCLSSVCRL